MSDIVGATGQAALPQTQTLASGAGGSTTNLGDILERVLDKGIVVAGDIQVNLLDIELLTIKLRLVIASLETAKEVGINWWEHDPWLSGNGDGNDQKALADENKQLRERVAELEGDGTAPNGLSSAEDGEARGRGRHSGAGS